ncbi:Uncharacterized protein dnl_37820 [Desulfonema limicola]|uniref:Uncharacterized protein n=1 Tax=Desulfonema limicola TaxID=45656 RepID=A0A975GHI8_9BACT|nr:Uncharacterized protein dnl_37820 [Desulfonema limicola]
MPAISRPVGSAPLLPALYNLSLCIAKMIIGLGQIRGDFKRFSG